MLRALQSCSPIKYVLIHTQNNQVSFLKYRRTNLELFKERNLGLTTRGSLTEEDLLDTNLRR